MVGVRSRIGLGLGPGLEYNWVKIMVGVRIGIIIGVKVLVWSSGLING